MSMVNDNPQGAEIESVAQRGAQIYEEIKGQYEPRDNGKWLAIDPDSRAVELGATSSEAVERARNAHPGHLFYVVKIGHAAAETLAGFGLSRV